MGDKVLEMMIGRSVTKDICYHRVAPFVFRSPVHLLLHSHYAFFVDTDGWNIAKVEF